MKHNCLVKQYPNNTYTPKKREYMGVELVSENGRVVTATKSCIDDPSTRYDGMKFSDFYYENLQAAGMDMKEMSIDRTPFTVLDACPIVSSTKSN